MNIAVIGKFFTNLKDARKEIKDRKKVYRGSSVIFRAKKGWIVVSKKQLTQYGKSTMREWLHKNS